MKEKAGYDDLSRVLTVEDVRETVMHRDPPASVNWIWRAEPLLPGPTGGRERTLVCCHMALSNSKKLCFFAATCGGALQGI